MDVQEIRMLRREARAKYREYKGRAHFETPIDREIRRVYQLIAQGKMIIRALDSVQEAGLNDENWPKLAIARADAQAAHVCMGHDGGVVMRDKELGWRSRPSDAFDRKFTWPAGTFPVINRDRSNDINGKAIAPLIPIHLRPRANLSNYHLLWEAEWKGYVPGDPFLLKRLGKGDMWGVMAAWDLTEVERLALQARVQVN